MFAVFGLSPVARFPVKYKMRRFQFQQNNAFNRLNGLNWLT
jgi:hypothetical protein